MTAYPTDDVVRITADCPFIDPQIVGDALRLHRHEGADYTSNTLVRSYPDGLDVEVIRASVLQAAAREARQTDEREHVTPFVYRQPHRFAIRQLTSGRPRLGRERWTLDNVDDFERLSVIATKVPVIAEASWLDLLDAAGTSAVFDDVDVVPDLEHVTDLTTRRWIVVSADRVIGRASVDVGADSGVLTLECEPAVRASGPSCRRTGTAGRSASLEPRGGRPMSQRDEFLRGEGDAWFRRNSPPADGDPPIWAVAPLVDLIGADSAVLEIGCSDGRNLAWLRDRTGCSAAGLDPSGVAIATGLDHRPRTRPAGRDRGSTPVRRPLRPDPAGLLPLSVRSRGSPEDRVRGRSGASPGRVRGDHRLRPADPPTPELPPS